MNGWSVKLKSESRRKTSFTPIETYINNKPVVSINYLFGNGVATNLEVPPVIPNTVKEMDETENPYVVQFINGKSQGPIKTGV